MLVYTEEQWRYMTGAIVVRRLASRFLVLLFVFFLASIPVIFMLETQWDWVSMSFVMLFVFPLTTLLFVIILIMSLMASHRTATRMPPAGVYENGIGLANGMFLPFLTMNGVERNRRYGLIRSDQVVFHTGEMMRVGTIFDDPTPRLPFDFLRMDGLMAIISILEEGHTHGPPMRRGPELIIYGPDGVVR